MAHARSASRRRWNSTKRSFRRRWPRYAILLLFFIAGVSLLVLVMNNLDASPGSAPIPAALQ